MHHVDHNILTLRDACLINNKCEIYGAIPRKWREIYSDIPRKWREIFRETYDDVTQSLGVAMLRCTMFITVS